MEHIRDAENILRRHFSESPESECVALSSFGKDSLAILALLKRIGANVDIAWFDLHIDELKSSYALDWMRKSGTYVHRLEPIATRVLKDHGEVLAYEFRLSSGDVFTISGPNLPDSISANTRCAVNMGIAREKARVNLPERWKTLIVGRKSCDVDPTVGSLCWPRKEFVLKGGAKILMPLLEWTESQLTTFLMAENCVPDLRRYVVANGQFVERDDKSFNPDYVDCCCRCLTATTGKAIVCELTNAKVASIARLLRVDHDSTDGKVLPSVLF